MSAQHISLAIILAAVAMWLAHARMPRCDDWRARTSTLRAL
jgi:hypothetical protein